MDLRGLSGHRDGPTDRLGTFPQLPERAARMRHRRHAGMMARMTEAQGAVIVGWDGSEGGRDALALAAMIAADHELVLAQVWGRQGPDDEQLATLRLAAESAGAHSRAVQSGSPAHGLHDLAEELGARLLAVGSSNRANPGTVSAGGTGERLLHGGPCEVGLAVKGLSADDDARLRVLGVAYDGSRESRLALQRAIELGLEAQATMRIFTVVPPDLGGGEKAHDRWRSLLAEAREQAPGELRAAGVLGSGYPARVLEEEAQKGVDLMVMGSRGYGPLRRVLLGGVTLDLVRTAPCSLLILPRDGRNGDDA